MSEKSKLTLEQEFEGINRTHDLDDSKFIAWVKKLVKHKTMRVNKYTISEIIDGKMLKIEVEDFTKPNKAKGITGNVSKGTRNIKGYLSDEMSAELEALLDKIPRKIYQDKRTMEDAERPLKIVKGKSGLGNKEIDLDNLFED